MVYKKDKTYRLCRDFRLTNAVSKSDGFPQPRIDEMIESLGNAKFYSVGDLASGYWQIPLNSDSIEKSAICSRKGLFEWTVLPFGLSSACATFQSLMQTMLGDMLFTSALCYIDDLIIYGPDFDTSLERLQQVCDKLRNAKLKLKPQKCKFFQKSVKFLGHIIHSEQGIHTDPEKISTIQNWQVPKTKKAVKSYLGICGYYRRFIDKFSEIAKPLSSLTGKDVAFKWDESCQKSFETLKEKLISAPILGFPMDEGVFTLHTDASNTGISGILHQMQNGREVVIAFSSRTLNSAEINYCTTRLELLAIVHHLDVFRSYLLRDKFIVYTDHAALVHWRRFRNPENQMARWLDFMSQFDMDIVARPGKANSNADGLSRKYEDCAQKGHKKCFCERFVKLEYEPPVVLESRQFVEVGIQTNDYTDTETCARVEVIIPINLQEIENDSKSCQTSAIVIPDADLVSCKVNSNADGLSRKYEDCAQRGHKKC